MKGDGYCKTGDSASMWVLRRQPDSAVSFHGGDLAIGKGFIGNKNKYQQKDGEKKSKCWQGARLVHW